MRKRINMSVGRALALSSIMKLYTIVSQAMVEYGSIAAFLTAIRDGLEVYIGQGNLKFLIMLFPFVVLLFWLRRH